MTEVKKVKIACQDCECTGLQTNQFTSTGTAMECVTCQGKGYVEAEYTPFKRRKRLAGIKKVFKGSYGCVLFPKGQATYELEGGEQITVDFDKYDCSYKDWANGEKKPIVVQEITCPLIASNQNLEVATAMGCSESAEMDKPIGCWTCYKNKEECWKKYNQ